MTKVYCNIICSTDGSGNLIPQCIIWNDNRKFKIDRVIHVTENATINGTYTRYVVSVFGQQKVLFNENDKWYVYK